MLFNSIEFAIFLTVVFVAYWFVFNRQVRLRNIYLIAVSYLFYGWWDWRFLILIMITSLTAFLTGLATGNALDKGKRKQAKFWNALNIIINITILCVFKYYNFFMTEFAARFLDGDASGLLTDLVLPVGISFYTFQALSYSIDVYRRTLPPTRNIIAFFAYIAFFPQLVAGPIERATNLLPQFCSPRHFDYPGAVDGMRRILWGLFKKIVVADNCGLIADHIFENYRMLPGSSILVGALFFSFQLYGDFSGYSDIAIGSARLFGFRLMDNFKFPYFSRNLNEFWQRWHISLTSWFRDYVYIPMGGSREGKHKLARNTLTVFLLSGLWHGADWTFIAWGGYHGLLLMPAIISGRKKKHRDTVAKGRLFPTIPELWAMGMTFLLVVMGRIFSRSSTLADALQCFGKIFSLSLFSIPKGCGSFRNLLFAMGAIAVMMTAEWLQRHRDHALALDSIRNPRLRWIIYYSLILCILFNGSVQTFIYFQF